MSGRGSRSALFLGSFLYRIKNDRFQRKGKRKARRRGQTSPPKPLSRGILIPKKKET